MANLFTAAGLDRSAPHPLADRLRPKSLGEVIGQEHLTGPDGVLTRLLAAGRLGSVILWGPPGTGKTTIARLLAGETGLHFEQISAIFSGVAELRKIFEQARKRREEGRGTLLFVDEIHRFNRSQQDSFLPLMEDGTITLIGATTENPSFELNGALLSRAQVLTLNRLEPQSLAILVERAEAAEGRPLPLDEAAREQLLGLADGDGRYLLNLVEDIYASVEEGGRIGSEALAHIVQRRVPLYDKSRDGHYNLISALHKSVRGSDPDAALYYLARMIVAGEDPLYLARRLVRMAIEDIGLRRSAGDRAGAGRQGGLRLSRQPGGRAGAGAGDALSGDGAQVQCELCRLWAGDGTGQGNGFADAAQDHPERADPVDEAAGIWRRLSL